MLLLLALTCNMTLLTAVLRKWHQLIRDQSEATTNDYVTTVTETLDTLLVWKDERGESLLFASNLNEEKAPVIAMNAQLMDLLVVAMTTCVDGLRKEHWDFILCSLVSWLQVYGRRLFLVIRKFSILVETSSKHLSFFM